VTRSGRVWLAAVLAFVGCGVWVGSARAVTFTQQTLAFSGLSDPQGVAVDLAGDVFVTDTGHGRVVKLSLSLTSGSFGLSPATGAAGSSIGLASVTPCTLFSGGAFAATEAKLFLYSSTGQLLESATARFGDLGSGAGSLRVPAGAVNGTTYVVRARCTDFAGVLAQAYWPATFMFQHLRRGRHTLTLIALGAHGKRVVIGRTTITIS
jgi:hypothetical protein